MDNMLPHRRYNPLTGEWVLVSPHRTKRPWKGQTEPPGEQPKRYEKDCYLCPGNTRAGGAVNPDYRGTFVFRNDFSALLAEGTYAAEADNPLMRCEPVNGECRVVCFSPRHDLTLPRMAVADIRRVVDVWQEQLADLGRRYRWVQIFENKGAVMGCSNPHPHGQIWAGTFLPNEPAKEDRTQRRYLGENGSVLLADYAAAELRLRERIVVENEDWVALVPYWAFWPFETILLPTRAARRLTDLEDDRKDSLADILKRLLVKYDNLFETSFPYSMGWHGAPTGGETDIEHWYLHAHFYPPLLRSATVKKFMVGYEMLGEPQRDLTAEQAAQRLRELPQTHFRETAAPPSS